MGKRTVEFVLGLIGGIFGFFGAIFALAFGGLGSALGAEGASNVMGAGIAAILFSVLAIVGVALVNNKPKMSGIFMIVSAIGGLISISLLYILPFVLLLIAGLMGLIRKGDKA